MLECSGMSDVNFPLSWWMKKGWGQCLTMIVFAWSPNSVGCVTERASCQRKQGTSKHTHTHLTTLHPGLPGWAGTRKVKPIWILLKRETVSGSGISWAMCKSAPCSRQITMPAPHHSVFYMPDALPAAQPTASKHWRQKGMSKVAVKCIWGD